MSWWDYGHMITYIAKRIPMQIRSREELQDLGGGGVFPVTLGICCQQDS
jgi:hypothetical protein